MSISPVSGSSVYSAAQIRPPAPVKRDKDGDHDNNAQETTTAGGGATDAMAGRLDIKA